MAAVDAVVTLVIAVGIFLMVVVTLVAVVAIPKNWQDHIVYAMSHLNRGRLYVWVCTCRAEREGLSSNRAASRFSEEM
jgi:hypothetical protein